MPPSPRTFRRRPGPRRGPGRSFWVRHVDRSIVVVEKKAGLLCQATAAKEPEVLLDMVAQFLETRGGGRVYPVHRLDRVVSGLIVYARTPEAQAHLEAQFRAHSVDRRYLAVVQGLMEESEGTFESVLYTEGRGYMVYSVDEPPGPGRRHAITHWKVLNRYKDSTFVEVRLETGVRNQIRVHFAEAGHPLLGERKYDPEQKKTTQGARRIFLHAARLGFLHPDDDHPMRFDAGLPPDLAAWKKDLAGRPPRPRKPPKKPYRK
ncbi:MAG: RNA pseudouridine synthase [Myxococcales bacterium]|nr:RNA pseudouridine synthase [Myxococcales bacterium]MCB9648984.1 RNA pseudouridine synthase [Deltaproteobacteria bacterium]